MGPRDGRAVPYRLYGAVAGDPATDMNAFAWDCIPGVCATTTASAGRSLVDMLGTTTLNL